MSAPCWLCGGHGSVSVFDYLADEVTGQGVKPVWIGCRVIPQARRGHFCPACALTKVNGELRAYGIQYPAGPQGVHDLAAFAAQYRALLAELVQIAGLSGDHDDWPSQLRAKLAACHAETSTSPPLPPSGPPTSPLPS
ncbi:MAG TPA: hypothetical protein VE155_07185 [Pseudonocardiaceae bacterium]|nr:hypothetical protein [Pseudonocardiaceae bacterium]